MSADKYFTIKEAAEFLASDLKKPINESDVFLYARRGNIRLCVRFFGHVELLIYEPYADEPFKPFLRNPRFDGYIQFPKRAITPNCRDFLLKDAAIVEILDSFWERSGLPEPNLSDYIARQVETYDPATDQTTYVPFEMNFNNALIPEQDLLDFLEKSKESGQLKLQTATSTSLTEVFSIATPDNPGFDKELAALFDPVPVEALEKTFPAEGNWEKWVERAKRNDLSIARDGRAKFNPYQAGLWFIRRGIQGWDDARLYRVLSNILPARSKDKKHLLTGEID